MKKNIKIIFAVLLIVIGVGTSFAIGMSALESNHMNNGFGCDENKGPGNGINSNFDKNNYHNQMESIVEKGTYQDLVKLRSSTGVDFANFVKNENDFNDLKQRHEQMDNLMGGMMR